MREIDLDGDGKIQFTWCEHNTDWDDLSEESRAAITSVLRAAYNMLEEGTTDEAHA